MIGQEKIDSLLVSYFSLAKNDSNEYSLKFKNTEVGKVIIYKNGKGAFLDFQNTSFFLDSILNIKSYTKNSYDYGHKNSKVERTLTYQEGSLVEKELSLLDFKDTSIILNSDYYNQNFIKDSTYKIQGLKIEQVFFKEIREVINRKNIETGLEERIYALNERIPYTVIIKIKYDITTKLPSSAEITFLDFPEKNIVIKDTEKLIKLEKLESNYERLKDFILNLKQKN